MYLVEDNRHGATYLVFTWEDPRKDGYKGPVVENVDLDYDMEAVHSWPDGSARPDACTGRSRNNPALYKVFRYRSELNSEGFEPVDGTLGVFGSWKDYVKLHLVPPDPEYTDDNLWYDYLDKLDEDSRLRHRTAHAAPVPLSGSRDDIADWVAKKHLITDSAIREIWYLPQGAPQDEIRLLEVNDRLLGLESKLEAIDFGLNIAGAPYRLLVADITSEQGEELKKSSNRLPVGWSLDGKRIWRRGA